MHMTKEYQRILDALIRLAKGNVSLVQQAFQEASPDPYRLATLEEVVTFIHQKKESNEP